MPGTYQRIDLSKVLALDMFDTIYLSPHLDDAALSCGGRIARETAVGKKVLIVTIMAGDPETEMNSAFIEELHARWQLAQDATAVRRAEDIEACRILGATYQHHAIPDCVYRVDPTTNQLLYPVWAQVIGAVHPAEQLLIEQLAAQFSRLPAHQHVIAPLAVGNHVDHQIVRQAAELCFGSDMIYYEDYPYVLDEASFTAVIPPHAKTWQAQTIPLSAAALQTKIAAIAAYRTQLSTFFHGRAHLEKQIAAFSEKRGGEQYWQYKIVTGSLD